MSKLAWYWHRLRAMSAAEIAGHVRKKAYQMADLRRPPGGSGLALGTPGPFPRLPASGGAPADLREALRRDAEEILRGRWKAFGHLELDVDDPPRWHKDYLVGVDLTTAQSSFRLDHRALGGGADIKLVWELSRWSSLVRLAMAARVLDEGPAAVKCLEWLEDWVNWNPPYRGWNWTSALEAGLRLIQFSWIDALLCGMRTAEPLLPARLAGLRRSILPAHVGYCWRHKSFGSSANNHLLGELTGLILAVVRWPELASLAVSLDVLQRRWEREVLAQFAEDGGNREQALHYHLFSLEFCCQARLALAAAGRPVSPVAERRIAEATVFYREVGEPAERWPYGDSDDAFVTPLFTRQETAAREWFDWGRPESDPGALRYWLGPPPGSTLDRGTGNAPEGSSAAHWRVFKNSGIAVARSGRWRLLWDLSPLGYLKPAAHGHLDALHLSIWRDGVAMVIDPGTGAYYGVPRLRRWLASRAAHNGPSPSGPEWPCRLGPFLWSAHHRPPQMRADEEGAACGDLELPRNRIRRSVARVTGGVGWQVDDEVSAPSGRPGGFSVRWQFAPGSSVKRVGDRRFRVDRSGAAMEVRVGADWSEVILGGLEPAIREPGAEADDLEREYAGTVSPAFRRTDRAPFLKLVARPTEGKPCVFRTTFLASPDS